jgi:hypothetical protein
VIASSIASDLNELSRDHLEFALDLLEKAGNARNKIVHGLFRVAPNEELISLQRRSTAKTPIIVKPNIMKDLTDAIILCEKAVNSLGVADLAITHPEVIEKALNDPQKLSPKN